ncbi:MAG: hypothetical protein ABI882_16015 [Acidobacteriota bacterium]
MKPESSGPIAKLRDKDRALIWLVACLTLGVALVFLFPDSCQQDGGYHFLFARWAWKHPELFVGVWARPLFTTLYALPALGGYPAAKLLTVAISLATAWQSFQLADELRLKRPELAIPLLFVQPSFFIISADTMTEPVFGLIFVTALRLHYLGRIRTGMLLASLLILARPEGFFLGVLWAFWVLKDSRVERSWWRRIPTLALLATGSLVWWLAALLVTGDPAFILHNWPSNWPLTGTIYGSGSWSSFLIRLPEIVGPLLIPTFLAGLWTLLRRSESREITSTFLLFFALHTVMRKFGLLGSAGYPRYFVAISPAIAVITLVGWNSADTALGWLSPKLKTALATLVLILSAGLCFAYFDGAEWIRDTRAVAEMHRWYEQNPRMIQKLLWSQAYMCIVFDRDPWENLTFTGNRERDLQALRSMPAGTLVFWDERFGPKWQGLNASDFTEAGYESLYRQEFLLRGYVLPRSFFGFGGPRRQVMYFFYKGG